MSEAEFTRFWGQYQTADRTAAIRLAHQITLAGGRHPTVVKIDHGDGLTARYGLMLPDAARLAEQLDEDEAAVPVTVEYEVRTSVATDDEEWDDAVGAE